jgi:hypothetical protein
MPLEVPPRTSRFVRFSITSNTLLRAHRSDLSSSVVFLATSLPSPRAHRKERYMAEHVSAIIVS